MDQELQIQVTKVPSIIGDGVIMEYEPSRSPKGVAVNYVLMPPDFQGDPESLDGIIALRMSLDTWDDACKDEHGLGIPSTDPNDYEVKVERHGGLIVWRVWFRDPGRWRDAVTAIARAARANADAQL
jgi:hypothetical protein